MTSSESTTNSTNASSMHKHTDSNASSAEYSYLLHQSGTALPTLLRQRTTVAAPATKKAGGRISRPERSGFVQKHQPLHRYQFQPSLRRQIKNTHHRLSNWRRTPGLLQLLWVLHPRQSCTDSSANIHQLALGLQRPQRPPQVPRVFGLGSRLP